MGELGQPPWVGQAIFITGVAVGFYFLGRWSQRQKQVLSKSGPPTSRCAPRDTSGHQAACSKVDEACQSVLERKAISKMGDLLSMLSQLPPKPFGKDSGTDTPAHSAARAVLVCASGKGGVGKSTTSVNLAFQLKQLGVEVGLLDLDVYGPSLPSLVKLPEVPVMQNERGRIVPLEYDGVALMSWGYIEPEKAANVRAPILNQMVTQLLTSVEWGLLDVLIIDTPPGTGDVLLSLGQTLPVDGAIIVTTSNQVSLADVVKGVQLFDKLEIAPLLVVANMATLSCEACGHQHELFADSAMTRLPTFLESKGIGLVKMPFDPILSEAPKWPSPPLTHEYPFVRNPDHENRPAMAGFHRLTHAVLEALLCASGSSETSGVCGTKLKIRGGGSLEVRLHTGELRPIGSGDVRAACRCAVCVDEMTGEVKIDRQRILEDQGLHAISLSTVGNYAVRVEFSDGHSTVVALRALEQMVGGGAVAWTRPSDKSDGTW